jgi:hypothetical protein
MFNALGEPGGKLRSRGECASTHGSNFARAVVRSRKCSAEKANVNPVAENIE